MNKKIPLGAAIAFMVIIAGITFSITMMVSLNHFNTMVLNVKAREEMYKKLADVDRNARQNYAGVIDEDYLNDSLAAGYIRGLGDRYSTYVSKEDYEYLSLEKSGQMAQIGVTVIADPTGYFVVESVATGSPAEEAGIMPGDFLISIDETDLKTVSLTNCERMLVGEAGEKITLVYRRDGVDTTRDMQRKIMSVEYVSGHMIDATGYIKISSFVSAAVPQFRTQLDSLIQQGAESIVIDLRNNSSDSLDAASSILNTILPTGDLGYTRNESGDYVVVAESDRYSVNLPMAIIVNARTGNVAEYFAATMRDFDKASIVGVQTMGKAVVQELIRLTDGSAINLTTDYIYPPSRTEINGVGVKPDYEVRLTTEQEADAAYLIDKADPQIAKAIEVSKSRVSS